LPTGCPTVPTTSHQPFVCSSTGIVRNPRHESQSSRPDQRRTRFRHHPGHRSIQGS
jgi:hypothetical protein